MTSGPDRRWQGMSDPQDDRGKTWVYAMLGILVLVLLVLIATGTVQIFPG
jgi:hypothetical protein